MTSFKDASTVASASSQQEAFLLKRGYVKVSLKADRTTTAQSGTLWTIIITTTAQADRTDSVIMLYAVNCLYLRNSSPKTDQNLMKFKKSKKENVHRWKYVV